MIILLGTISVELVSVMAEVMNCIRTIFWNHFKQLRVRLLPPIALLVLQVRIGDYFRKKNWGTNVSHEVQNVLQDLREKYFG